MVFVRRRLGTFDSDNAAAAAGGLLFRLVVVSHVVTDFFERHGYCHRYHLFFTRVVVARPLHCLAGLARPVWLGYRSPVVPDIGGTRTHFFGQRCVVGVPVQV